MANKRRTPKLDQQIDENLRRVYADKVEEPLPERFTRLLDQLREQERAKPQTRPSQSQARTGRSSQEEP